MSVESLNEMIQTINDILQDLRDMDWRIHVTYLPKRFNIFKSDTIRVDIRKNKCGAGGKYSLDSEFRLSDISNYTLRIIDYVDSDPILISICEKNSEVSNDIYLKGEWDDFSELDDRIFSDTSVLGIVLQIPLDGDNLDQFDYNSIISDKLFT